MEISRGSFRFSKGWKLGVIRNRRGNKGDIEESFSDLNVSFDENEPEKRCKRYDDFLSLEMLVFIEAIEIVTDISEHDIHRSRVDFIMGNEIMKGSLVKRIKKEWDFELCIFWHEFNESMLSSDSN